MRLWVPEAETSDPATGSPGLSVTSDSCALAPSKWTPGQGWRGGGGEGDGNGDCDGGAAAGWTVAGGRGTGRGRDGSGSVPGDSGAGEGDDGGGGEATAPHTHWKKVDAHDWPLVP